MVFSYFFKKLFSSHKFESPFLASLPSDHEHGAGNPVEEAAFPLQTPNFPSTLFRRARPSSDPLPAGLLFHLDFRRVWGVLVDSQTT